MRQKSKRFSETLSQSIEKRVKPSIEISLNHKKQLSKEASKGKMP